MRDVIALGLAVVVFVLYDGTTVERLALACGFGLIVAGWELHERRGMIRDVLKAWRS